jgi:hypothetical protein
MVDNFLSIVGDEGATKTIFAAEGIGVGIVLIATSATYFAGFRFGHVLVAELSTVLTVIDVVVFVSVLGIVEEVLSRGAEGALWSKRVVCERLEFSCGANVTDGLVDVLATRWTHVARDVLGVVGAVINDVLAWGAEGAIDVIF